jgi:hypothetical protein
MSTDPAGSVIEIFPDVMSLADRMPRVPSVVIERWTVAPSKHSKPR